MASARAKLFTVTGDPETARRMLQHKQPAVSDLFLSLIDKKPVYNVNIPVLRDGEVRYILILGHRAEDLQPVVAVRRLGPEWTTTILDKKGVLLAHSKAHDRFVGKTLPAFEGDITTPDRAHSACRRPGGRVSIARRGP